MAAVPKPVAVTSTSPTVATRTVAPASRVASISTTQIDALNEGTNISFDAAATGYQEEHTAADYEQHSGGRRNRATQPTFDRLFTADSEIFAAILEDKPGSAGRSEAASQQLRQSETTVSKVISTYEDNALIISGNQPMRGTSLSFSL